MVRVMKWVGTVMIVLFLGTQAFGAISFLRANLVGGPVNGVDPSGRANFRRGDGVPGGVHPQRVTLDIDVNCPGKQLPVVIRRRGLVLLSTSITLNNFGQGFLNLDNSEGDNVPGLALGDRVNVMDNAMGSCTFYPGQLILSGRFRADN